MHLQIAHKPMARRLLDETSVEGVEQEGRVESSEQSMMEEGAAKRSYWMIMECYEFTDDIKEYRRTAAQGAPGGTSSDTRGTKAFVQASN